MNYSENIERLTRKHTAFYSFRSMVDALGGYRPSLRCSDPKDGQELTDLADHYDTIQNQRGDRRRACRS